MSFHPSDVLDNVLRRMNRGIILGMDSTPSTRRLFLQLAEPYLAGHSIEEGLDAVKEYASLGRLSTVDVLGEAAVTVAASDRYVTAYKTIITQLGELNIGASVSVKPTAICAVNQDHTRTLRETPLIPRLEEIVSMAKTKGVNITLDMEDHPWTSESLHAAQELWRKGYDNLGIVLQARLDRTEDDIAAVLSEAFTTRDSYQVPMDKITVRACIGIYREPRHIATTSKREAKERLISRVKELFDAGVYVQIATHDHKIIDRIINEVIVPQHIASDRFEFQFLKGVQNAYKKERELMEKGYKVRYYMPLEIDKGDGTPYIQRRLIANPTMIFSAAKNVLQSWFA